MTYVVWRGADGLWQCTRCLEWRRADTLISTYQRLGVTVEKVWVEPGREV
jgi:hypothetical protein